MGEPDGARHRVGGILDEAVLAMQDTGLDAVEHAANADRHKGADARLLELPPGEAGAERDLGDGDGHSVSRFSWDPVPRKDTKNRSSEKIAILQVDLCPSWICRF